MDRRGYVMLLSIKHREKYHYFSITNLDSSPINVIVKKNNANAPTVKFYYANSVYEHGTFAESSTSGWQSPSIGVGETLYIRGVGNAAWAKLNDTSITGYNTISASGKYAVGGHALALLDASNVHSGRMDADAALFGVFNSYSAPTNKTNLIDASEVILPSVMRPYACRAMFNECTSLTAIPKIQNIEVADYCFYHTFRRCNSLVSIPKIELTFGNAANYACYGMFMESTSLVSVGEGSVMHVNTTVYNQENQQAMSSMFKNCTSLVRGVDIDGTHLKYAFCFAMYENCTSLASVPRLSNSAHKTVLAQNSAFARMFKNCVSLTSIGDYDRFAGNGYAEMFMGCTGITSLPSPLRMTGNMEFTTIIGVDGSTVSFGAKQNMFRGCTGLVDASGVQIIVMAESIANKVDYSRAYDGTFRECTALTQVPDFSHVSAMVSTRADANTGNMFESMFRDCTSLVTPPVLPPPASIPQSAYQYMFSGCTSLATAPSLAHITTIQQQSFAYMFENCRALATAPDLDSVTSITGLQAFYSMFFGCTGITAQPKMPTAVLAGYQVSRNMFDGCTRLAGTVEINISAGGGAYMMFNGTKVTSAVINNRSVTLGQWAFQNVRTLRNLDINRFYPEDFRSGYTSPPNYVFTLDSLTIRGDYAPASITQSFINALSPTCQIKVHANRVDAYKSASLWNTRAAYISAI